MKRKENTYQIVLLVKVHVEEVMIIILINNLIILKGTGTFRFFNNYSDKMPLEEVIYQLIKISW